MRSLFFFCILSLATTAYSADEIHWTITGQNSVTFDWRGAATENSFLYGVSPGVYTQKVKALMPSSRPSSLGNFWEAKINGLQANTTYYYRIGNNLQEHAFRTPPQPGNSDFSIYAEGDIGSTLKSARVKDVQALVAKDARFVLMVGDLTYGDSGGLSLVDRHFNDVMLWSQDTAYMPVWGNHDWNISLKTIAHLNEYKGRFNFPNSKTSPGAEKAIGNSLGEDWYWFDYGNVRFIAYPEPFSKATWTDWQQQAQVLMDAAQTDKNIDFIVTFGHRPAYSSGFHPGESILKTILNTLGDKHNKYVLNINGHSHNYERSLVQHGVIHVTSGTGGASLEVVGSCLWAICKKPDWSSYRAMHHGITRLNFTKTGIHGTFICGPAEVAKNDIACKPGDIVDTFAIGK
jgi:hypothetical protein